MTIFNAKVTWNRKGEVFTDNRYSRLHEWSFDGGAIIPASASPHVVPAPYSDPKVVDPEEAFLAALSSCHMLWFLSITAKNGFVVDEYNDNPEALMLENSSGESGITKMTLRPNVSYSGDILPDKNKELAMHREAHKKCFIANSVKAKINISPRF